MKHSENIGIAGWVGNMLKTDPILCGDGGSLHLIIKYLEYKGHKLPAHIISALNTLRTARSIFLKKNPRLDKRVEDVKKGGKYHELQTTFDDFYSDWLQIETPPINDKKTFGLFTSKN